MLLKYSPFTRVELKIIALSISHKKRLRCGKLPIRIHKAEMHKVLMVLRAGKS